VIKALSRSHFAASVLGGLVVAVAFLAFGVAGRRTTETIVEQSPIATRPASGSDASLTPHAIYERDAPGVVFVRAQVGQQVQDPFDLFQQQSSTSTGSGFLIDPRGYLLTNYHVIEGADRRTGVTVRFEDNVARPAAVAGEDPDNDLALLKVSMSGVPPVKPLLLGESTSVRVGDPTLAIGNPFGLDRTLTSGIVSALQRQIQAPNGFAINNVIQTDVPINPGNSGGPLIDAGGKVVGINSQIASGANGTDSVGIAFAVPIDTAREFLPRLEQGARIEVAYLGFQGVGTPGPAPGVMIQSVQPGGPAAVAGLRKGDEIDAVAGRAVTTTDGIQEVVEAQSPGATVAVRIRRHGHTETIPVALGSRPTQTP
jgi:S1-C subfamily serine protease